MPITTAKALRRSIEDSNRHLTQLKLELGECSDLVGITHEIRHLRSARRLVIGSEEVAMDMSEPNWLSEDAFMLFDALAALRGVQVIQLQDLGITFGPQGPRFPVVLLTRLLQTRVGVARGSLKRLNLSVRLAGDHKAFQELAHCLEGQHSLQHVAWEEWCFPTTDVGNDAAYFDFNPIVAGLASLPRLESLSVKAMTAGSRRANLGTLAPATLSTLISHARLRQLQLAHFQLDNKTVRALANALPYTTTLQLLSIDLSKTGSRGATKLFDSLRENTTIADLQIWASTHSSWAQDDVLKHLAKNVLTRHETIESVTILTHSRTLQEAVQNLTVVNDRIASAFVRMMETNYTLEHLVLDDYGSSNIPTKNDARLMGMIHFYLALNQSKRRQHLMQEYHTYSRSDWTDLLAMAVRSDRDIRLEALYYFLRLNPSLCQL
ncbi:expressed unknown protein [Seminavis robusta]|uniref:Uncharacterized protein n=1 Tax=Seminavis robusta TaxID=568900 RepID=A0A9N8E3Q9_9STRA|nr:expressed unknown protein [Seminavis robusta]|eukprot:Sro623_g177110.1 n/a (436) ;mRNA; f:12755-14062